MNILPSIVLFDTESNHTNLLPLSFTRPVCDFRIGITTIRQKWEDCFQCACAARPVEYLRAKFSTSEFAPSDTGDLLFIAGNTLPNGDLKYAIQQLESGQALVDKAGDIVAFRGHESQLDAGDFRDVLQAPDCQRILYVFDIFLFNAEAIKTDFRRITKGRRSQPLPDSNRVIGPHADEDGLPLIFIEEGASVEGATLNTTGGPIYIGGHAQVMEGACMRGPISLNHHSKIKMGAKIYGGTTFGPWCKIGGEVDNTVIFGYSNKAHDGYLGNAVIGEWCNLGAGVNSSNLKNDYSKIRVWNYASKSFMRTQLQFCGLIMGDHSKAGINVMFNTATVVGVGCNIYGAGFPRVFIPSFSEGGASGFTDVTLKKFYTIAERVMSRRGISLTSLDKRIYERVFEVASSLKGGKR